MTYINRSCETLFDSNDMVCASIEKGIRQIDAWQAKLYGWLIKRYRKATWEASRKVAIKITKKAVQTTAIQTWLWPSSSWIVHILLGMFAYFIFRFDYIIWLAYRNILKWDKSDDRGTGPMLPKATFLPLPMKLQL